MKKIVLLTGVSGYIGLHCAQQLLAAGYRVRGTVRSATKEKEVRDTFLSAGIPLDEVFFVKLDLTSDWGWDAALQGCDFVMHVASPFTIANPKTENEMIVPAVEGTRRVLRAAKKARVKRVVLTSSTLSMMGSMKRGTFGPSDWTDVNVPDVSIYTKSKTLAEKSAWDFIMAQAKDDKALEMDSVSPGGVFGPPLGRDIAGQSIQMLDQMLRGKTPMLPKMAFPMVDVRDVAKLHVAALEHPSAMGQRLIAAGAEPCSLVEIAQILKDQGYKGPSTRTMPDFMLRFMALFDREARGMLGMLGMNLSADNTQTRKLFDWTPIPYEKSISETAAAVQAMQHP